MEQYKLDLLKYRIERSKETSEEAEIAISHNKFKLAENRIYYAIFYMVNALSILSGFTTAKHKEVGMATMTVTTRDMQQRVGEPEFWLGAG